MPKSLLVFAVSFTPQTPNFTGFSIIILIVLVIVSMCPGDHTSARALAAITRPPNQYCNKKII